MRKRLRLWKRLNQAEIVISQKQINPANEFGPSQSTPLSGNKEGARGAGLSEAVLDRVRLRDLPTKKEKLLALADAIEAHELATKDIGFNMGWYFLGDSPETSAVVKDRKLDQTGHTCGTVACIAGWASLMDDPTNHNDDEIANRAQSILGISDKERGYLFGGDFYGGSINDISTQCAVAAIRDLANTGRITNGGFDLKGNKVR